MSQTSAIDASGQDIPLLRGKSPHEAIAIVRAARGETLEAFGKQIGVGSKGRMSEIERGVQMPTPEQALAIEEISGGAIDASALNPIVARARGVERVSLHGAGDSANLEEVSTGKAGENFPQGSPGAPPTGAADPGGDGSASGESLEQDRLPGRADLHTAARSGDGLAPEGTSGGSAGFSSLPANASQCVEALAAAEVGSDGSSSASCADDMPEAAE